MFPPSKKILFGALSTIFCVIVIGLYMWKLQLKSPRRVFVTYSEKLRNDEDSTKDWPTENDEIFAEERLLSLTNGSNTCFVLTRNKAQADYLVNIKVTRYTGGHIFGEASLSILDARGDIVLVDTFFQDRTSKDDIAQQPITETWRTLCPMTSAGPK